MQMGVKRGLQGEGGDVATPLHGCSPQHPSSLGMGPFRRRTPSQAVERGGGAPTAWNKETKPHSLPAHLSSPWTGSSCSYSPASMRPPGQGPQAV